MIKASLCADQKREAKLSNLGDALQVMEQHVDSAAPAAEINLAAPRLAASAAAVRLSPPGASLDPLIFQQLNKRYGTIDTQLARMEHDFEICRRWPGLERRTSSSMRLPSVGG
jgi:hypothetical protein